MQRVLVFVASILAGLILLAIGVEASTRLGPILFVPAMNVAEERRLVADCSRILGVSLSLVVSLCALAIPLTANVYTPKLIEIFVSDRLNRSVVGSFVLANVFVLWNQFVLYDDPPSTARLRIFACLVVTLVGLAAIGPYIVYVLRFLVPRSIVRQLEQEVSDDLAWACGAKKGDDEAVAEARLEALENIKYLGNIALRSVDRYDRDTAFEALRALRGVFDAYQARKDLLPPEWFRLREAEVLGLGPELGREVERKRAAVEVAVLQELALVLPLAIARIPEVVATIAGLTRRFGCRTMERRDVGSREMVTLFFNTFLRVALQHRSSDAFYKFVYQYRRFAEEALDPDPAHATRVAFFLDYYGHQASRMGLGFLINVVAYDLAALCELAWRKGSPCKDALLGMVLRLDRDEAGLMEMPGVVKAQVILAAKLRTRGEEQAALRIVDELRKVPREKLAEDFGQIVEAHEENFWEIADRRRHLDHVEPEFRPAVDALRTDLLGPRAHVGERTQRFLAASKPTETPPRPAPPTERFHGRPPDVPTPELDSRRTPDELA
jgi:hypothetical protein